MAHQFSSAQPGQIGYCKACEVFYDKNILCEFQAGCRKVAVDADDLSLLSSMTEKERRNYRSKGIFTVTQLAYTFRPRRRPKKSSSKSEKYHLYEKTCGRLLRKIARGKLIHADETRISVDGKDAYVWVFTNLEEVVYLYTETREGEILQEVLKDFKGILVSDFYAAYDSIDCPQQKCLHLFKRQAKKKQRKLKVKGFVQRSCLHPERRNIDKGGRHATQKETFENEWESPERLDGE